MLKYIREKIWSFLLRLFNNEEFKQMLWDTLILIIKIVRDKEGKTKTDS